MDQYSRNARSKYRLLRCEVITSVSSLVLIGCFLHSPNFEKQTSEPLAMLMPERSTYIRITYPVWNLSLSAERNSSLVGETDNSRKGGVFSLGTWLGLLQQVSMVHLLASFKSCLSLNTHLSSSISRISNFGFSDEPHLRSCRPRRATAVPFSALTENLRESWRNQDFV